MKYIIASDIHGSADFCAKLLERSETENAEGILLLGDILYHGPRNDLPMGYDPKKVITMLNALKERIICVRGNCDAEVDQMVLEFDVNTEHRCMELFGKRFFLTHGHHISFDSPDVALGNGCEYLLYGHTHIPFRGKKEGTWFINPGSVSIPKNGSSHSYILLDSYGFRWKTLDGREYDSLAF